MIEPRDFKLLETYLAKLIDKSLIRFDTEKESRKLASITFGKRSTDFPHLYTHRGGLKIGDCAWELWHKNAMLFAYLPNFESNYSKHLESLKNAIVTNATFDTSDFSLTISLDNSIKLKLLHSIEDSWYYTFMIGLSPVSTFEIKNGEIFISQY